MVVNSRNKTKQIMFYVTTHLIYLNVVYSFTIQPIITNKLKQSSHGMTNQPFISSPPVSNSVKEQNKLDETKKPKLKTKKRIKSSKIISKSSSSPSTSKEWSISLLQYTLLQCYDVSQEDINDIMAVIYSNSDNNNQKLLDIINFITLFLTCIEGDNVDNNMIITRDTLIAIIFHYCESIHGIHGYSHLLPSTLSSSKTKMETTTILKKPSITKQNKITKNSKKSNTINELLNDTKKIQHVEKYYTNRRSSIVKKNDVNSQKIIQNALISIPNNWISLVIRCVVCYYQLQRILENQKNSSNTIDTKDNIVMSTKDHALKPQDVKLLKDALHIYIPISQRLGLQILKNKLQQISFQLLYPRQYNTITKSILSNGNHEIYNDIANYLVYDMTKLIQNNEFLMEHLANFDVTFRIKESYSLWNKLFRKLNRSVVFYKQLQDDDTLSILSDYNILDMIALRIIVQPKTPLKEKELCYYILSKLLPKYAPTKIKDYIKYPKVNGYQSLHYISNIFRYGYTIPFEIQIRSRDMHNVAEFGYAAHWDYKLLQQNGDDVKEQKLLPPSMEDETTITVAKPEVIQPSTSSIVCNRDINNNNPYFNALSKSQDIVLQHQIFILFQYFYYSTSKNNSSSGIKDYTILSLPKESRVMDCVMEYYKSHLFQGDNDVKDWIVYRNGVEVSCVKSEVMDHMDIVTLIQK